MTRFGLFLVAISIVPIAPVSAQQDVPMIPRTVLLGPPARTNGQLSPDGQWLSWLAPRDGIMNIWVAPVADPKAARAVTDARRRPIRDYSWAPDSKQILYGADKDGDENFMLYGVDVASGEQRALTAFEKSGVNIIGISGDVKDRILIGINNRDRRWHDVHSLDLGTGKLTPVLTNTGYGSFIADRQLNIRIASKPNRDGGEDYFRVAGNQVEATPFERVALDDSETTEPIGFTADGRTLYWRDSRGRDTAALIAQDVASGRKTVLAESAKADIGRALTNPKTGKVEAYAVHYLKTEWVPLDRRVKGDLDVLKSRLKAEVSITSRTAADDKWIVAVTPVTAPPATYLYDRKSKMLKMLYIVRDGLQGATLAAMHPVEIKARDGLTLVSYLTLPPGSDANGDGRPERPVPMVLAVHGGPWDRDSYGFNTGHQWLANRGYAVLSTNFRGSTGFGKKFIAAGNLQWGKKMHDDLLDAVDWAVKQGVTTRDKVGIMGGSYGGYAVLAGLAFTPDTFACGVDAFGQNDIKMLLEAIPAEWEARKIQFYKRVGDPTTPDGQALLREASPLFKAHQVKRPLLVSQGANDPRVKIAQSDQVVDAIKIKGVPVTYMVFPDEGHGYSRPANSLAFYAAAENFLAKCLGGRAEPFGDALKASSVEVRHGAAFVPGLEEALGTK